MCGVFRGKKKKQGLQQQLGFLLSLHTCGFTRAFTSTCEPAKQQTWAKIGLLCWLWGEDRPRERPREWQLALAYRTTANGTLHLLLPFFPPTARPSANLWASGKCPDLPCCLAAHHIETLFTSTVAWRFDTPTFGRVKLKGQFCGNRRRRSSVIIFI